MTNNKTLEMALEYAAVGFRVFPLNGKKPMIDHWNANATTDPAQITEWFTQHPNANIGILTGQFNGKNLVVVDLDVGHSDGADGTKTLAEWEKQNGKLPETLTVKTGSGGYHLYYFVNGTYKNGTNILKGFNGLTATGIDVKTEGGYLVAPPSVHPETGESYEWIGGFDIGRIADGGEALDKLLTYRSNTKKAKAPPNNGWKSSGSTSSDWQTRTKEQDTRDTVIDSISDLNLTFKQGSRNDDLYRLACSLQAKGIADKELRAAVFDTNECLCAPPLETAEVEKIIESALKQPKGKKGKQEKLPPFSYEGFKQYIESLDPPTFFSLNEVTREVETFGREENDFIDNVLTVKLVSEMKGMFSSSVNNNLVDDYISLYAYEHRHNPVIEQIDGTEWDGVDRLKQLYEMLGIIDDDLSCIFQKKWLMEAYCGLFNTKKEAFALDLVLVFQGKQGFGKTRLLEKLALGYFGEGESLNPTDKDSVMEVSSCFIGNTAQSLQKERENGII